MNKPLMRLLFFFILPLVGLNCQSPASVTHAANHLINESSPYLLQHAYNPVDWYPWGDEALEKAKKENKLILVSIGYSACHWCHVMEHESFEDSTVAALMNQHFVNIKVDREERPDVDDVYITACHLATGRNCGWPLNAFALPDGRPVWAGTYFPKKEWMGVLEYFVKTYEEEPDKLQFYAGELLNGIQENGMISPNETKQDFQSTALEAITHNFLNNIDFEKGGIAGAPKFPMPVNYQFLLEEYHRSNDDQVLKAIMVALDNMAMGGIYDHLGGGFARYSTDSDWKVPHFEKMLYDNAQLVSLYANAFKVTQNPLYEKVVKETLEFIGRELTADNGSFYSSLDADSEGEEGKFYIWTKAELDQVMADEKMLEVFSDYYEVSEKGNWENSNILYRRKTAASIAEKHGMTISELEQLLSTAKQKLFLARDKRIRPGLDDKVLTSWNALMLKAYLDAFTAFGNEAYLLSALKNADFLLENMWKEEGRLNRNYKDGQSVINAFLDDYALLAEAFLSLYQVTFDEKWLYQAKDLADYANLHFYDDSTGMFYYTSDLDPPLVARKMQTTDNVIPASNSVMARVLHQLGLYFYNNEYLNRSRQMLHNMSATIVENEQPNFYSNWCRLYGALVDPPYEVAIVGEDYETLQREWLNNYLPNALLLGGASEGTLELLKSKLQEGETYVYVCQNKVCKFPVTTIEEALNLLKD